MTKTNVLIALMVSTVIFPMAFENNKPGWKMDGDKIALDSDGNPIYINAAGQEQSVKGDTISNLNAEAKKHRTDKEKVENDLAKYKGSDGKLIDPEVAVKAIDTVSKLDAKQLIDVGEVDKVKDAVKQEFTGQLAEKDKAIEERDNRINSMLIDGVFKGSEFIADQVAMPRDFFEANMRGHFKVEEGKPVAYGKDGNRIMSKKNLGEYANPEEALEILVEAHPQKDTILKAPGAGGSGNGGGGGSRGGGRFIKRADFEKLGPAQKAESAALMGKGELTITD